MSKGTKKRKGKNQAAALPENALPQNILPMGERVEEDKNIYISQEVYKEIHRFTKNKTTNESGGILVGTVIEELGKVNILISGFVEAKFSEGTPTTLTFTHETWDYVHKEIDKKHQGKKIVGWIHTHPDFGIFLSEYDKFIHQNFFNEDYHVAYVVDPIQKIEGFYFWINGNLERCKGFYIYDKTGSAITVDGGKDTPEERPESSGFSFRNVWVAILSVIVVFLIFMNISANQQLAELQKDYKALYENTNQAVSYLQQNLLTQQLTIQQLQAAIQPTDNPTEGDTTEEPDEDPTEDSTEDSADEPIDEPVDDNENGGNTDA